MAFDYKKVVLEGLMFLGLAGNANEADAQTTKVRHKKVNSTEEVAEIRKLAADFKTYKADSTEFVIKPAEQAQDVLKPKDVVTTPTKGRYHQHVYVIQNGREATFSSPDGTLGRIQYGTVDGVSGEMVLSVAVQRKGKACYEVTYQDAMNTQKGAKSFNPLFDIASRMERTFNSAEAWAEQGKSGITEAGLKSIVKDIRAMHAEGTNLHGMENLPIVTRVKSIEASVQKGTNTTQNGTRGGSPRGI